MKHGYWYFINFAVIFSCLAVWLKSIQVPEPSYGDSTYLSYKNTRSKNILFVGHQMTSANMMPYHLTLLSVSQKKQYYHIYAEQHNAHGNKTLEIHWNMGEVPSRIAQEKWDYVILQEDSVVPVIGDERVIFTKYVDKFNELIKTYGAHPILMGTWPYLDGKSMQRRFANHINYNYDSHHRMTNTMYDKASERFDVPLITLADFFHNAPAQVNLYQKDGATPSPAGSYLVALVIYKQLFDIEQFEHNTYVPSDVDPEDAQRLIAYVEQAVKG